MSVDTRGAGIELRSKMLGRTPPEIDPSTSFGFMDGFINDNIFGELWQRTELDLRTRSLCTIAAVVAARMPDDALRNHIVGALANGATEAEISEAIVQTAIYAGVPVLLAATAVANDVFSQRDA